MMAKPVRIKMPRRRKYKKIKWRRIGSVLLSMAILAALVIGGQDKPPVELLQNDHFPSAERTEPAVKVFNADTGQVMTLDFEEYLTGVVAAEMPVSFEPEALKAQAVAARTFAYSRLHSPAADPAAEYYLTTDPATCQAWISAEEQEKRWGEQYADNSAKIEQAVQATKGELVTYQHKLIEPLYHASCGSGYTESAKNVWGGDRPYLVSVSCEHPPDKHDQQQTTVTLAQLDQLLDTNLEAVPAAATGGAGKMMSITESSPSNRVLTIRVADQSFSGAKIRSALGLKSTLFSYQIENDKVTFTTNGYGHGVGMCQYGANYYAQQGHDYRRILQHYYTGVEIEKAQ